MRLHLAALLCATWSTSAACFSEQQPGQDDATDASSTTQGEAPSTAEASNTGGETSTACACAPPDACVEGTCVPVGCGDGIVADDEDCDEGPDNAQSGACKLDCTLQICGDGQVGAAEGCDDANDRPGDGCDPTCVLESCGDGKPDPGEACDDGNRQQGDGCNNDCQPSGVIMWEHMHDGAAGGADSAFDVDLFSDAGDVVVVGAVIDEGTTPAAWYRVLDPNGAVHYTAPTTTSTEGGAWLFGVACDPPLCVAVGHQQHPTGLYTAIGRMFSPDGEPDGGVELQNPFGMGRVAYGLALSPSGVDMVGFAQNGFADQDGLLEELDGTLASTGSYPLLPGPGLAVLRRIVRVGDWRFIVGWSTAENMMSTNGYLLRVDPDGTFGVPLNIAGSTFNLALALAVDADESVIVAGYRSDAIQMMGPGAAMLRRYAPNDALVWQMDGTFGGETARFDDVALTATGDIVAVGAVRAKGGTMDILVARHAPGGNERWTHVISDPGYDLATGVAIDPDTDAIYVVGRRTVDGSDDVWAARFSP